MTGAAGMLGSRVVRDAPADVEVATATRADADLAEPNDTARLFARLGPAGVIHCAGFTAVDEAESVEARAHRDNAVATREVAAQCARLRAALVVVSTDYVFDGRADRPYREDDPPAPLSAYGRTKLAAERAARAAWPGGTRIVRTSWLYGPRGAHFPGRILALARERDDLRVVDDQRGCPTSTLELAPALWDVLLRGEAGTYHAACEGTATWCELARAVLELAGVAGVRVRPCTTAEMPRPAARPANSALDCARLAELRGRRLAPWRDALARYLAEESR